VLPDESIVVAALSDRRDLLVARRRAWGIEPTALGLQVLDRVAADDSCVVGCLPHHADPA